MTLHSRCPECAKNGRDTSHDNLVMFDDGGCYCFACGYSTATNAIAAFKNKLQTLTPLTQTTSTINLPEDVEYNYPERALKWIGQYDIPKGTLLQNHVVWSEKWQRLIFPYFIQGELLGWQGRYFGTEGKAKWFSQGQLHDFLYILGDQSINRIVLVEDIISAIKVSKYLPTIPLFGSIVGKKRWLRIAKFFDYAVMWLDPDMKHKMLEEQKTSTLFGLTTEVIFTEQDPKETSDEQIQQLLFT